MHDYIYGLLVFLCSVSLHVALSQLQMPVRADPRPSADEVQVIEPCDALAKLSPENTFAPGTINYASESQALWTQTAWLEPSCVFVPENASVLATGITILSEAKTPFAVRGGGFMPVIGHASTDDGVLITTSHLNELSLIPAPNDLDAPYLRAGAGLSWGQIYDYLEPHDLMVVGGRVSPVGTSLLLGGGISYFSSMRGWAANNVVNFEVALANGTLVNANENSNPDLFWALKGGSNNFGVVSRYDLMTHPCSLVWGGAVAWDAANTPALLEAQASFMLPGGGMEDRRAGLMSNIEVSADGQVTSGAILVFDGQDATPSAFENFTSIMPVFSTLGVQKLATLLAPTAAYGGRDKRSLFASTSLKIDNRTMGMVRDHVVETARTILPQTNCSVGAGVQPVSKDFLQAARDSGGDPLDLDPEKGSFAVILIYAYWFRTEDDALMERWSEAVVEAIEVDAKSKGLHYPFYFLNDASKRQRPFETYGYGRSLPRLREISQRYDPDGVFQTLVPGFKLGVRKDASVTHMEL